MRRMEAYRVYLIQEGASALLMSMIFTASSIYQVTRVGLTPLQLVLVGTTLEAAAFLFEVPTGVVADVYSRRLSVIIGMLLIGVGFLVEGTFPVFWLILAAQVLWGLGYTFTSGATQAWISDEIGEAEAGRAFMRANQVGNLTALVGIGAGMWLGSLAINLPIQMGGAGMVLLGLFLAWKMPETGFTPAARAEVSAWTSFRTTFSDGLGIVRRSPALLTIMSIGLVYGPYSEGFDRLWTKHILDQFSLPLSEYLQPVFWFGLIRMAGLLLSTGLTEVVSRRVDTASFRSTARVLYLITILLIGGLFVFAMAPSFYLAVAAYILVYITRNVIGPVFTAWVNQGLEFSRAGDGHLDEQPGGRDRADCRRAGCRADRQPCFCEGCFADIQLNPDACAGTLPACAPAEKWIW